MVWLKFKLSTYALKFDQNLSYLPVVQNPMMQVFRWILFLA